MVLTRYRHDDDGGGGGRSAKTSTTIELLEISGLRCVFAGLESKSASAMSEAHARKPQCCPGEAGADDEEAPFLFFFFLIRYTVGGSVSQGVSIK